MSNLIKDLEQINTRLQEEITRNNEQEVNHLLDKLQRMLIDSEAYLQIWDERVLAETEQLMSTWYGEALQDDLTDLRQHLAQVRAIHDKLFAILDPGISLDVLLYNRLYEWRQLDAPVSYRFTPDESRALQELRAAGHVNERVASFLQYYLMRLATAGHADIEARLRPIIDAALVAYDRTCQQTVYALFATAQQGEVRGLTIGARRGSGQISAINPVGPMMEKAANCALECLKDICPRVQVYDFRWAIARDDIHFEGNSIGLALTIGIMAQAEMWSVDPYTAFTGHVDWATGSVGRIESLAQKFAAAHAMGIRRVFIPVANHDEVTPPEGLQIIAVSSVLEAKQHLQQTPSEQTAPTLEGLARVRITELTIELKTRNITITAVRARESYCKRVICTDFRDEVFVDVFYGQRGLKAMVQPQDSALRREVQDACDRVFGSDPAAPATQPQGTGPRQEKYLVKDATQQQRIKTYLLQSGDAVEEQEKNCWYRLRITRSQQTVYVRHFTSGTLTVQGPSPLIDAVDRGVRSVLGIPDPSSSDNTDGGASPKQDRRAAQIEAVASIERGDQWIGTDEAGKGDYFGPLVGAAVLVNVSIAQQLVQLGVKDSKSLSDRRVKELAERILQICGPRAKVVPLVPETYNQLYEEFRREGKNLNTLLAWVHTRALEDLVNRYQLRKVTVIIDKFADESYIKSKLSERGREAQLDLRQLPKAEADIAVAAASVLARAQFLQFLERASTSLGIALPKGSSDPQVVEIAQRIVKQYGRERLDKLVKLHFATTTKVLTTA